MPSYTRRFTANNPSTANAPLPDVSSKEHVRGKVGAYRVGYQDAVNETVSMARPADRAGRRALGALQEGNAKPYRALARRRNPLGD